METAVLALTAWVFRIGYACLWGSLGIAAIGLLCRLLPRLPSPLRAWFWWLACGKMLLDLTLAAPIALPVLPTPTVTTAPTALLPSQLPVRPRLPAKAIAYGRQAALSPVVEAGAAPAPPAPRWPAYLFMAWLLGGVVSLFALVRAGWAQRRQWRGTVPARLPNGTLEELARQVGLRRVPRVLTGPRISTPCVTGRLRPTILLPPGLCETLSPGELRLTLAHEMAHVKRGDLWLVLVPALARCVFFFHPLVWWAASEWAAAREEACDARALSATRLSRADYGRLLLKLASPEAAAPALGLSPGYHGLRRRLLGLTRPQAAPRGARLLVLALPLLLPWRLTAAVSPAQTRQTPTSGVHYTITLLADDADSTAAALNDTGKVALTVRDQGYAGLPGQLDALGALPKHHASLAYGINAQGLAAGASYNIPGHGRAFYWNGAPHRIGSLPGYPYSEARGISNSGLVAGFAETGTHDRFRAGITRAFLWQSGTLTDLGTLGGPYSAAYAVSGGGVVVGKADTAEFGATHAFAWADNQMTDLGTLGGANSVAYAVNAQGAAVGASELDTTPVRHAFLSEGGQMRDLGTLPGLTDSAAYAVSNSGTVVGVSQNAGDRANKRATLWQNGTPTDLNALLPPNSSWILTEAHAINDHGQIAGQGLYQDMPRAFLLTPR